MSRPATAGRQARGTIRAAAEHHPRGLSRPCHHDHTWPGCYKFQCGVSFVPRRCGGRRELGRPAA